MTKAITQFYCSIILDGQLTYRHVSLDQNLQSELGLIFEKQINEFMNYDEEFLYDGRYKVDANEVLYIDDFTLPQEISDVMGGQIKIDDLTANDLELGKVKSLFGIKLISSKESVIGFQGLTGNNVISRDRLNILLSGRTFQKINTPGITLNDFVSAVYKKGRFYFKSFVVAKRFIDLDSYLKEASDEEIKDFLKTSPINLEDPTHFEEIKDEWIRKKIYLIHTSNIFDAVPIKDMKKRAKQINLVLKTNLVGGKEKIEFPSDKKSLKDLLRFLDDDILDSLLTGKIYVANSKRVFK
ncbi:Kiwa anti-phage protein KwaB-like domain-containing protein [Leptospira sp. WS58.C1]|uniref:Kiwa anti-phage protein KwaB-like domain-containing protein n=1 Tax=Leptospira cinconiae TaxID=3235173 RepID=UPI00349ECFA6